MLAATLVGRPAAGRAQAAAVQPGDAGSAAPTRQGKGTGRPVSGKSLTLQLAEYAAATSFQHLPQAVRERAKKVVFDEIASAHLGRRSAAGGLATRYATSFGGHEEARIFGTRLLGTAPYAAMANGTAGHGEEVDGAHVVGGHPGASIVHAAMAMAERQRVPGTELLCAVALGYDVGVRIVKACGGKFAVRDGKHLTSDFFYALGSTAAAGRILGLDADRHCHALALATFQVNGLNALYAEKRHISKSFCNGQYAFAGVSAALMSAAGLEGNEDIIGAPAGILDAWADGAGQAAITQGLGSDFAIMGGNFKFFNAGYPIHTPVEAANLLVAQHGIAKEAVQGVLVGMPENAMRVVDNREMHNICVQDMLAAVLSTGGLKLRDQPFPAILTDPSYQRIRALIRVQIDPELQRDDPNGRGARVTITTRDGQTFTRRVDYPRGHSKRGEVSWDDLADKWNGALVDCDVGKALGLARRMEDLEDIRELAAVFAGNQA
jgi:2-methylcitrate dehydratase PrpD